MNQLTTTTGGGQLSTHLAPDTPFISADKLRMLGDTIMKDATPEELQFFGEVCSRTKLDPFRKQIHAVKRWDSKARREVWSFQTGVDGFRAIAHRSGDCAGIDDAIFDPVDESTDFPRSATVTVYRLVKGMRVPFTAKARWGEYVQTTKDGNITSMWLKLPYSQLGKCAECLALRKAFPEDLSDIRSNEEMGQAENPDPAPVSKYRLEELEDPAPAKAVVKVAAPAKREPAPVVEAEQVPEPKRLVPTLLVPEGIAELTGGAWKGVETVDGKFLGNLKGAMLTRYREQMPEPLRDALSASYIDQILSLADRAGMGEEEFADAVNAAGAVDIGFPGEVWLQPELYPALLAFAKTLVG